MIHYVHQIPGRLRIKTPLIKRNQNVGQEIMKLLSQINGIKSIAVNPVTGSVLIKYDSKTLHSKRLLEILDNGGYVDPRKTITNDQYIQAKVSKTGNIVWKALFGAIIETALAGSNISLIALLL